METIPPISRSSFAWKPDSKPPGFQSACRGHSRTTDTVLVYTPLQIAVATLHTNPWHVSAKDRYVLSVSTMGMDGPSPTITHTVETLDDHAKAQVRGVTLGRRFIDQLLNPTSPYRWIVRRCTGGPRSIIGVFDNQKEAKETAEEWQGAVIILGESLSL